MATNTTTTITDDLDGKAGATPVIFGLDGKNYTIDLGNLNAANLRKSLEKYVAAATEIVPAPAPRPTHRRTAGGRSRSGTDTSAIRAWAKDHGYPVGSRGRIDSEIVEAHQEAMKTAALEAAKALAAQHDEKIDTESADLAAASSK